MGREKTGRAQKRKRRAESRLLKTGFFRGLNKRDRGSMLAGYLGEAKRVAKSGGHRKRFGFI